MRVNSWEILFCFQEMWCNDGEILAISSRHLFGIYFGHYSLFSIVQLLRTDPDHSVHSRLTLLTFCSSGLLFHKSANTHTYSLKYIYMNKLCEGGVQSLFMYIYIYMCVCVCEREREKVCVLRSS